MKNKYQCSVVNTDAALPSFNFPQEFVIKLPVN